MVEATVIIKHGAGLHARPAANLVKKAMQYKCSITLQFEDKKADAKSIMQVLALGAGVGKRIKVSADGPEEDEALAKIVEIIQSSEV